MNRTDLEEKIIIWYFINTHGYIYNDFRYWE